MSATEDCAECGGYGWIAEPDPKSGEPVNPQPCGFCEGAGQVPASMIAAARVDQPEAEWHEWRGGGIGGSDIAALIGLSRYSSPTRLYYEKIGLLEPTDETQRQRIGKRMEAVLAAEFHDMTGLWAVGEQTWCTHRSDRFARCTVDGFAAESQSWSIEHVLGTVQYKTDGRYSWPDGVPPNIRAQCIWEMGVTGLPHCWLVVMFAGFRVEVFEIPWDADAASDWDYMLGEARRFWREHVVPQVPPPVDGHDATTATLVEIHRDPAGDLIAQDSDRALVARLRAAKATTAMSEENEARIANELRARLGDHTDLVDHYEQTKKGPRPVVLASWREQTSDRVDVAALRAFEPDVAKRFTKTTTTRVLRVAKAKED